jgi:hemolysin III
MRRRVLNNENFTVGEEIFNAILHGIGFGLAIAALVVLIVIASISGDVWYIVSFTIYGATLVILYLFSTLYHSLSFTKARKVFKVFDHASIYLLIAGTYTPFTLITMRGPMGWILFGMIWAMAIIGIVLKSIWIDRFMLLSTLLYVIMGWLIIIGIAPLLENLKVISIAFLFLGGIFYTVGTIFFIWRLFKFHHAIWHLFVLAGSVTHFFAVLFLL